jgi:FAD/FMN-containing dehydrogenase
MPDYESSRLVFNRAYDRHPAVIVRCAQAKDVGRALEFAQKQNLPLAVRSGGHSRLGYGMCDGGVVIDLSAMKRVEVNPGRRVAQAEAGALVRDLDEATQRFGLATTSGGCPTVGITGLTLGGGEGRLDTKYGLACDNLLSAQVVTVDGRMVEASQKSNPDLFWAIRGVSGSSIGRWLSFSAGCALPNEPLSSETQRPRHCRNHHGNQQCAIQL